MLSDLKQFCFPNRFVLDPGDPLCSAREDITRVNLGNQALHQSDVTRWILVVFGCDNTGIPYLKLK